MIPSQQQVVEFRISPLNIIKYKSQINVTTFFSKCYFNLYEVFDLILYKKYFYCYLQITMYLLTQRLSITTTTTTFNRDTHLINSKWMLNSKLKRKWIDNNNLWFRKLNWKKYKGLEGIKNRNLKYALHCDDETTASLSLSS